MVEPFADIHARAFLNIKALTGGDAKAEIPGGELQAMVNGQLLATVNGQLQAIVNGQSKALVNTILVDVTDMAFQNGRLLALVNEVWTFVPSGQIIAIVNGQPVTVELSVSNGQLQAVANGQLMTLVNGQLQAPVNGQILAIVNGQLKEMVNADLTPLLNGQLIATENGNLTVVENGQLRALVNGQLMIGPLNDLEVVEELVIENGQLRALVNGQLRALVNGQLRALVNGVTYVTDFSLVGGEIQATVNSETWVYSNGQLRALVNGQLRALVNGSAVEVQNVKQLANGQLRALVNGVEIPLGNGQLQALVNDADGDQQLLTMANGQLMAVFANSEVSFVVFNGQLRALVNGEFVVQDELLTNGQLRAIVNGELQPLDGAAITNGQLRALVNGEEWIYPNGQLRALVNGQFPPMANNFDVSGPNNNAKTLVLVDEDDLNLQSGDISGMFSVNMITGLDAGYQTLIPGAFVNENFEVTYGLGQVLIKPKPLIVSADNKIKDAGDPNPPLTVSYNGFAFDDTPDSLCLPVVVIDQLERRTTYTNVQINGASNVYVASPGEMLTLTGNWSEDHFQNIFPGYTTFCPGCITQHRIGMVNESGGNAFATCDDVSGLGNHPGIINIPFTAPSTPGIYYITQLSTWWFTCPAPNFGDPPQIPIHNIVPNDAIAVVVVNPYSVPTYTTATEISTGGVYPIIVGGCYFNPNYRIVFQDGTLTVGPVARMMNNTIVSQTQATEKVSERGIGADRIYPNPASSIIRLQLKDDVQSIKRIKVYDGIGQLTSANAKRISDGFYEINLSGLVRGVYIIEARTAAGIKTFKFIKM
jgi:hypothetical protein